jgi:hypothetical protein
MKLSKRTERMITAGIGSTIRWNIYLPSGLLIFRQYGFWQTDNVAHEGLSGHQMNGS